MKNVFYFLASFVILSWLLITMSTDYIGADLVKLKKYSGYIVTSKENNLLFSNYMIIRKNDLSYKFTCDDIIFTKYEVGDTIKVK